MYVPDAAPEAVPGGNSEDSCNLMPVQEAAEHEKAEAVRKRVCMPAACLSHSCA